MAVGRLDNSVGFIIQARMESTRLPGKVLMPMPFITGKPILGHIIDALKPLGGKIIVATSKRKVNEPIKEFCIANGVGYFLGDEDDVLSRFISIQKENRFEYIFRFTADNPLVDVEKLMVFYNEFKSLGLEYAYSQGMPLGMNFELFSGKALLSSETTVNSESDREHVTPAIRRNESYKTAEICLDNSGHLRMTVDTAHDFALLSMVFDYRDSKHLQGMFLVKAFFKEYPWLIGFNNHVAQKKIN
ncbi:MAG: spore coat polysaccharide biosynthesis protein SpsF [Parvicella sp.]|jgi:spore coat polysaccharide biosynthesis protein SpsF